MLPFGAAFKAVDNVQLLSEAKSVNKHLVTILRHYTGSQHPSDTYEGNVELVEKFLKEFLDETFWKGETKGVPHRHIDYIEDWNEYGWFNSQDAKSRERFRLWAIAFLDVWYLRYWPKLDHPINVCIANIPVGNDLDLAVAKRVAQYTNYEQGKIPRVGYHSYWPTRDKVLPYPGMENDENWWIYYAGRILEQDKALLKQGIVINYALTEAGPIGYNGTWPHDVHLIDVGGWREGYNCGGDIEAYKVGLHKFMRRLTAWNKANGNRCLTPNLYDSSQAFDQWKSFQLNTKDLKELYKVFAMYLGNNGVPDRNWVNPYVGVEPEPEPEPEPPTPDMVPAWGIDVSRWQGKMNWEKAMNMGVDFAIIKATEGSGWEDPEFDRNWEETERFGILRGPYHFFLPEVDPLKQANWFVATVQATGRATDIPYVADVEKAPAVMSASQFRYRLKLFLQRVAELTGLKPLIYTSPGFYNGWLKGDIVWSEIADLWVAHWIGVNKDQQPYVPPEWAGYVFWQHGVYEKGLTLGAQSTSIDINVFNGPYAKLVEYCGGPKPTPPPSTKYVTTTATNVRTQPKFSTADTKIMTVPAGTYIGTVTEMVEGEPYNGDARWAKCTFQVWVGLNKVGDIDAYLHASLLNEA